jgi:4a-hydroxytetrahydrobiopterin dehydratase
MPQQPLPDHDVDTRLAALPSWSRRGQAIARSFRFASFADAMTFMQRCAFEAERLDHHPDWANSYDRVDVSLSTHDAGGVTARDFALAEHMDTQFARLGAVP